ncbi:hypothetical protein NMY22_g18607 [Coprinellus aureogranulatus]|nr:hypothetical protein NMY22_g18607 [Coprinellus aureogranulatus]
MGAAPLVSVLRTSLSGSVDFTIRPLLLCPRSCQFPASSLLIAPTMLDLQAPASRNGEYGYRNALMVRPFTVAYVPTSQDARHRFDIYSFGFNTDEDEKGMLESARQINQLITEEVDAGVEPSRIILGGFSQGGTMSLLTGLTGERKLGGLIVLSGWLPLRNKFKAMANAHARNTPIFWGHGSEDPLVKLSFSKASKEFLTGELGVPPENIDYRTYSGLGHSTSPQELQDIKAWLINAVPDSAPSST